MLILGKLSLPILIGIDFVYGGVSQKTTVEEMCFYASTRQDVIKDRNSSVTPEPERFEDGWEYYTGMSTSVSTSVSDYYPQLRIIKTYPPINP